MRERSLGSAGPVVRTVGLGEVSLVRAAARGNDAGELARTVHAAIEAGLDLVDVAAEPDTERLVADAVRTLRARDRIVVATRVPALAERAGAPTRDVLPERLPARYVQEQIEATLRASRLEVIPLAQLALRAAWRGSRAWPEVVGTCARLVREGKVLAWGALVDVIEDDTPELAGEAWLAAIAAPFALTARAAEAVRAAAAERELAFLARHPLAGGGLAGTLGPGVRLATGDDRRALPAARLETLAVTAARLAALVQREPPAARSCDAARAQLERNPRVEPRECVTLAELALRFVIDRGAIALPRLHRGEHLAEALAAAAAPPLSPALHARLDEMFGEAPELDT